MLSEYMVNWLTGEIKEFVAPKPASPTPPAYKGIINNLDWAKMIELESNRRIRCEKYGRHDFDGTMASHVIQVKFSRSPHTNYHLLCWECAAELWEHICTKGDGDGKATREVESV